MLCQPVQVPVPFKLHPRAWDSHSSQSAHTRSIHVVLVRSTDAGRVPSAGKRDEEKQGVSLKAELRAVDQCPLS